MKTIEYLCWTIVLAGVIFCLDLEYSLYKHRTEVKHVAHQIQEMNCPDIHIIHFVGSNLKTGERVVDGCSEKLIAPDVHVVYTGISATNLGDAR